MRADEPERKPRQWRDLTVVAALLTVLLSVPSTVWAVLVAQDQLHQSREADTREVRAQASRVSTWLGQDTHGKWAVHLMNRSPDPITQVHLTFWKALPAPTVAWAVMVTSLPPCTDMTITQDNLIYDEKGVPLEGGFNAFEIAGTGSISDKDKRWHSLAHEQPLLLNGNIAFLDRNGVFWARKQGRLIQEPGPLATLNGVVGHVTGLPTYRALDGCEDSAG
ncbi:hypothetical protein [Streptomyces carpinensis]|uniref:Uncharacterized protein n=1 Tax=Streptomyces carpinensis TaxID=66369 RepID=A0ABV1W0Q3_9ACTN|nr:hypothetical protein [Streptomyces carpinensis]